MNHYRFPLAWCLTLACAATAAGDDQVLSQAHELELAGKNAERQSVLTELNQSSSSDATAHWLSGEIKVGGQWLPYRRLVDEGDRWAELHRYREERAKKTDSVDHQFFLADGCRQHRLFDEERAHLHGVIAADPENAEARQRLGDQKIEGVWVTAEEAHAVRRMIEANQRALKTWGKTLQKHVNSLSDPKRRKAALAALKEVRDPAAIAVMEELLARGTEQQQLDYLDWVHGIDSWKSAASMARLAVASDSAKVRVAATRELKTRRLEEFVPTILGSMVTPVEIRSATQEFGNWVFYSQHAVLETQQRQYDFHYMARYSPEVLIAVQRGGIIRGLDRHLFISNEVTEDPRGRFEGKAVLEAFNSQVKSETTETNGKIDSWNGRCSRTLQETTEVGQIQTPQDWWAWWEDDQGNISEAKEQILATYQEEWFKGRRRQRYRGRRPGTFTPYIPVGTLAIRLDGSCFAAGTPVMTEFGPKPIESIVRGDRVLSQDVETGELAFKPVLRPSQRLSPGSLVVKFGDEQLTCTPCHPFWVNGEGWRMARELAAGDRFHSMSGAVDVTGVEVADKVEVFNLVVADFHTYFVGNNPILTHDVTVRQPTDMLLPGYTRPIATTTAAATAAK